MQNNIMIGKLLNNRYELESLIDEGGMSLVYLANDKILKRKVAIKLLKKEFSNEKNNIKFEEEANTILSLSHNNIVEVYDYGKLNNKQSFIVMEYIEGQTLKDMIRQKGFIDPRLAVKLFIQILEAIKHSHEIGIIHKDIKPHNILILKNNEVKLTDFGISVFKDNQKISDDKEVMGSVHYISPAQAKGEKLDERADIYSLGIVFFEMLTGEIPFNSKNPIDIAIKHIKENVPYAKDIRNSIPQTLENVITRSTVKNNDLGYEQVSDIIFDVSTAFDNSRKDEKRLLFSNGNFEEDIEKTMQLDRSNLNAYTNKQTRKGKSYDFDKINREFEKKKNKKRIIYSVIMILLIVISSASYFLLFNKKEMPNIIGDTLIEAKIKLSKNSIEITESNIIYEKTNEAPKNVVYKTTPLHGQQISNISDIRIYVNEEKPKQIIAKNWVGEDINVVRKELEKNLIIVEVSYEESTNKPDRIIQQNIKEGDEIQSNDKVSFIVSKAKLVKVPELNQKPFINTKNFANENKLKINLPAGKTCTDSSIVNTDTYQGKELKPEIDSITIIDCVDPLVPKI